MHCRICLVRIQDCDFCACKDICGFDQRIEGCEYRQLQKYSLEEAVECMKEKLGIKKSQE